MLKKYTFTVFIALSLLFTGCGSEHKKESKKVTKEIVNPNIFKLTTLKGKEIVIEKKGNGFIIQNQPKKLLLLDIYATWCPPCRAEAEVLGNLQSKFNKNLVVVGITIEENIQTQRLQQFAQQNKADYTLVYGKENTRLINNIAQSLQVGSHFPIPLMALYKEGKLLQDYSGATEEEFIQSDIQQALGK